MTVAEKKQVLAEYNVRHPDRPGTKLLGPYNDPRSELPYFVVLGAGDTARAHYPDGDPNQATDDQLAAIARRVLRLDTLLPRGGGRPRLPLAGCDGHPGCLAGGVRVRAGGRGGRGN